MFDWPTVVLILGVVFALAYMARGRRRRHVLIVAALAAALAAPASAGSWKEIGELVASKAQEFKLAYTATWQQNRVEHGGGIYLPIHTLHSTKKAGEEPVGYLEWGIGAEDIEGSKRARLLVPITANLPALSRRIWRSKWRREHVSTTALPPIWIGPFFRLPSQFTSDGFRSWVFAEQIGIICSIQLGRPWFKDKDAE